MGAIISVRWSTDNPRHEELVQQVARQIEQATGESVSLDIGITDNRATPNALEVGKIVADERFKIR